MIKINTT